LSGDWQDRFQWGVEEQRERVKQELDKKAGPVRTGHRDLNRPAVEPVVETAVRDDPETLRFQIKMWQTKLKGMESLRNKAFGASQKSGGRATEATRKAASDQTMALGYQMIDAKTELAKLETRLQAVLEQNQRLLDERKAAAGE
jgi:hypothetical protein